MEPGQTNGFQRGEQFLKRADYARARGITYARVTQLVQQGLVKLVGGYVDVAASDERLADNVRQRTGVHIDAGGDDDDGGGRGVNRTTSLLAAQARAAEARARLTELKVKQVEGGLIDREEAIYLVQVAFGEMKKELMMLPERLAGRVREAESEHAARMLIEGDVRGTLRRCVDQLRRRFSTIEGD